MFLLNISLRLLIASQRFPLSSNLTLHPRHHRSSALLLTLSFTNSLQPHFGFQVPEKNIKLRMKSPNCVRNKGFPRETYPTQKITTMEGGGVSEGNVGYGM